MELFEGQPRDVDEGPGLLESVWQYKWLIAIVALLGAVLGYGREARQPTLYEGSTSLLLSIGSSALPGDSNAPPQEPKRFLSNQAELITSRPVLQLAAKGRTTVGDLGARLAVEVAQDADVITIHVRDATPEGAAQLATAVGTAYNQFVLAQSSKAAAREVEQLDAVANELKAQLQDLAAALQRDPGDPILQARQGAVREQLNATVTRSQGLAARARVGASPVQLQEPAAVPQQPVQPTPRRGAAAGLLLGLVGSAALAWWLNIRRVKEQEAGRQRHGRSWAWRARRAEWQESSTIGDEFGSVQPTPSEQEHMGDRTAPGPAAGNGGRLGAAGLFLRSRTANMPAADGGQDLRGIFERLEVTFGSKPLDWYLDNAPQLLAEQLTMSVSVHMGAVLLDNAQGSFVVAGGFGLTAEEQSAILDQSEDVLRQTLADGVGVFQDNLDRPTSLAAGLPGSQSAQALVLVPLVYGPSWLGMLVAGRHSSNGHHVAGFNDQEVEHIISYALEIAPMLQTLLLLDRLRESVRSLETPRGDHVEPTAG
jgi:capsular polysaccharide biosynthesis protein